MTDMFPVLLVLFMLLTLGVLVTGVVSFGLNSEFHKRNSNKLMRLRVVFQALALVFFALLIFTVLA